MRANLTRRQSDILFAIRAFQVTHGYSPSRRELQHRMGLAYPSSVTCHLNALRKKGVLTWDAGRARTLRVVGVGG
ncbi:MAG: transcriptional regulator [Planctomycetota bacterium]